MLRSTKLDSSPKLR